MTHKTGREQQHRKPEQATDAKQQRPPVNLNFRSQKSKTALRMLSRGHRHWAYNRRISG